jgi:hypothetical protein
MLQRTPTATDDAATRSIAEIRIGERHRKDLGDLQSLAQDIAELGLIHAIPIAHDNTLIAGVRRLEACRLLGWERVPVRVVNLTNIVRGAVSENAHRKDYLPSEIDAIRRSLEPLEKAAAKQRQTANLKRGRERPVVENFPNGRTRDKIAAFAGISGRTIDKIAAVCEAARRDERFRPLVEAMDRTGKVNKSFFEMRRRQVEEEEAVPIGKRPDAKVIAGDWRQHNRIIKDGSVDLVFTDLPYHPAQNPQYGELAEFAARVLVEGGSLITYVGRYDLPDVFPLMTPHLKFWWMCAVVHSDGNSVLRGRNVLVGWKPLLWFVKGTRRTHIMVGDCVRSSAGNKTLDHPWAQGTAEACYYIQHLSRKNSLIVDPYLGGGTTGVAAIKSARRFVGFEIDPATARRAKARISRASGCERPDQ